MLPRWCNSIPDSEFLAIYDLLDNTDLISPYFVETGSGASTVVLFWFALKGRGRLYTWDTNGSKLYFIRTVIQDTILRDASGLNLWDFWCPVSMYSTSEYCGIGNLEEFDVIKKTGIAACFLDSAHTVDNLLAETELVLKIAKTGSVVIIDDSNYRYLHENVAFANMVRRKMGLHPCQEPQENISELNFGESVEKYLKENCTSVTHLEDTYKDNYKDDLFWAYYKNDRKQMAEMDMEKIDNLEHRFDAWRIQI